MKIIAILILTSSLTDIYAQDDTERAQKVRTKSNASNEKIASFPINNNTMPNRFSMNVSVGKQTITVQAVEGGAIVLFPNKTGLKIDSQELVITEMTAEQYRLVPKITKESHGKQTQGATFGEKVNAGLHATGSIVSAAVSSGSSMVNSGASSAAYAKSQKPIKIADDETDYKIEEPLPDGEYELSFILQQSKSGLKDTLKTQVRLAFSMENSVLKTKHDTAKNSISNIR